MVLVHLHLPTSATDPPMLVVFNPHATSGSHAANLAGGDGSTTSGEAGELAASPQGGQVTPPVTIAGEGSAGDGEGVSATTTFTSALPSGLTARTGAMGWVTFAAPDQGTLTSLNGAPGGQNWPMVQDVKRLEVTGMLDADQTTMTFEIPVGPMTAALGLTLDETAAAGGMMPEFGQMELVNPNGTPIAQVNPPPGVGPNMLQSLAVLLRDATANSHLQVQIVAAEPSSGATGKTAGTESGTTVPASSGTAGAGANFNVSFVLEIQRQDLTSPIQETSASSPGALSVGTLIVAPSPQSGSSVSSSSWSADLDATAPVPEQEASTTASVAATETPEQSAESFDGFNVRVSTGPLASRTASPLGPTLASIDAEATQEVDRRERAMSQEIDGLESMGGESSVAWRSEHPDSGSSGSPGNGPESSASPGANDGPVIDAPGNGGYPMKVTSHGRGPQSQISALWATLPSFAESGAAAESAESPEIPLRDLALESAALDRSSPDFSQAPNYVKAACGMVFGLMMTSGPLFPDLIAGLPRRVPRWVVSLRLRVRPTDSPGSSGFMPQKILAWLRGRRIAASDRDT